MTNSSSSSESESSLSCCGGGKVILSEARLGPRLEEILPELGLRADREVCTPVWAADDLVSTPEWVSD